MATNSKHTEGWSNDVASRNLRHYYRNGESLCKKAIVKPYMNVFDKESTGSKYAKDCNICIKKLKESKLS